MAAAVSNLTQGLAAQAPTAHGTRISAGLPTPPDSLAPQQPCGNVPSHTQLGNPSIKFYNMDAKDAVMAGATPPDASSDAAWQARPQQEPSPESWSQRGPAITGTTAEQIAKFYLPKMLLYKGEKKIGTLMRELCDEAPAYAALEPPRRRRLMDAALAYSAGGGPDGSIVFTKTNWGQWKAAEPGHHPHKAIRDWASASRGMPSIHESATSPPDSVVGSFPTAAFPIAGRRRPSSKRDRRESAATHSTAASSLPQSRNFRRFSHNVFEMDEDEDDVMSLDGHDDMQYVGYRHAEELDMMDDGSDTEVEDWEAMGADGLRAASSVNSTRGGILPKYIAGRGRGHARHAQSVPTAGELSMRLEQAKYGMPDVDLFPTLDFSGTNFSEAERQATEALMRMGSMPSRASVASTAPVVTSASPRE